MQGARSPGARGVPEAYAAGRRGERNAADGPYLTALEEQARLDGGVQRDRRPGQRDAFAIGERLGGAGEILAVAKPHQVERFLGRQHSAMTGAGVIGMGVGNDRAFDRPGRVDMEAAAFAADPGRRRNENVFRSDHKS